MNGDVKRPQPPAVGTRVLVFGRPGVVEALAWSHAVEDHIVTVAIDTRMKVRVRGQDIVREQP